MTYGENNGISLYLKVLRLYRDENIVRKEEIARYEQFLLLPQCFKKSEAADES